MPKIPNPFNYFLRLRFFTQFGLIGLILGMVIFGVSNFEFSRPHPNQENNEIIREFIGKKILFILSDLETEDYESFESRINYLLQDKTVSKDINKEIMDRVFYYLVSYPDIDMRAIDYILSHGQDINAPDPNNRSTILRRILKKPDLKILSYFIDHGLDANSIVYLENNDTGLMYVALNRMNIDYSLSAAELLLKHGANINLIDNRGYSALMHAVCIHSRTYSYDNPKFVDSTNKMVEFLIQNGADVNFDARNGDTALSLAEKNHFDEAAAMIKAAGAKQ
ncbi:MAG: hypothetical protein QM537_01715 [Candidatus Symbiobacter sp.]|nr:hypothetical protein [Candidatus Symbiobacter sp.]